MKLALYQPDIAQNLGTILRTAACLDVEVEIIEPCGFPFDDRKFKRAGMDYIDHVKYTRHNSFEDFKSWHSSLNPKARLILLTTKSKTAYTDFSFEKNDILLLGRESAGAPNEVHEYANKSVTIPMKKSMRSLNIAVSASMVLGEALRQTESFPSS